MIQKSKYFFYAYKMVQIIFIELFITMLIKKQKIVNACRNGQIKVEIPAYELIFICRNLKH